MSHTAVAPDTSVGLGRITRGRGTIACCGSSLSLPSCKCAVVSVSPAHSLDCVAGCVRVSGSSRLEEDAVAAKSWDVMHDKCAVSIATHRNPASSSHMADEICIICMSVRSGLKVRVQVRLCACTWPASASTCACLPSQCLEQASARNAAIYACVLGSAGSNENCCTT